MVSVYLAGVSKSYVIRSRLVDIQKACVQVNMNHQTVTISLCMKTARVAELNAVVHQALSDALLQVTQIYVERAPSASCLRRQAIDGGANEIVQLLHR